MVGQTKKLPRSEVMVWFLDLVPKFLRTRRPFRKYFWQQEDVDAIWERARERRKELGFDD